MDNGFVEVAIVFVELWVEPVVGVAMVEPIRSRHDAKRLVRCFILLVIGTLKLSRHVARKGSGMRHGKPSPYSRLCLLRRDEAGSNGGPVLMQSQIDDAVYSGTEPVIAIVLRYEMSKFKSFRRHFD